MILDNLEDKIALCYSEETAQYSNFLTMEEISAADHLLRNSGLYYRFWGGYEAAERKITIISLDEHVDEYPFELLCGQWDKFGEISHRDVLGAVMASGIERRCIGDILFDKAQRRFYMFTLTRMSEYIRKTVVQIGKCSIVWFVASDLSALPCQAVQQCKIPVSSLRIDAVIATVFHLSRQRAQDIIDEKSVFIDHTLVTKVTQNVREGCSVVVRGYGKFIFLEQIGLSKKGKPCILIKQYL